MPTFPMPRPRPSTSADLTRAHLHDEDDVYAVVLSDVAVILVAAWIGGAAFRRLRQPCSASCSRAGASNRRCALASR